MKVTLLGTGTSQGVPVIGCSCEVCQSMDYRDKRLRVSVHIELEGKSFVIDTGPDFRQQMLRENISQLDAVLLTHSHKDHIAGLDDIRAFNFMQQRDMPVYGTNATLQQLRTVFYYAFEETRYPGTPQIQLMTIDEQPFHVLDIPIIPLPVMHLRMPVLGFRIGGFSYITDANFISPETMNRLVGTEVLILNALQREPHISHFTLQEAIDIAKKVGARQTYFTHISHKLGLHKVIEKELPNSIALGFDGLSFEL
ncbi:MAG: MBL fold metallo-hydrolase [Cyclobacteriaceae bacterium]|nr:MBL fold metallo-hydrolase [Flammeovirgaceae bacterium]